MYRQLMKVSKGFKLVYIGVLLVILGVVGGILGACIAGGVMGAGGGRGGGAIMLVVAGGVMLCVLGGSITGLVGRFFCLAVPDRAGSAKPLIIISLILELSGMVLGVFNSGSGLSGRPLEGSAPMVLQGASVLCSLGSAVLFLLFTRSVANFVRRSDLADAAMLVLWLWVATMVLYGAGIGVMLAGVGGGKAGMAGGACAGLVVMLVALILALIALVRYVNLLREMADAVAEFAGSGNYPRRRRKAKAKSYEDDEDDEDDRPRRRKRRDDDDEDEDDEDDDDPRRRRRHDW
jgi:hypothetical protein